MNRLKSMWRYALFPGWLALAAFAALLAFERGLSSGLVVMALGAASFALVSIFERLMPYRKEWNRASGDIATDIASFGVAAGIVDPALKILGAALAMWIAASISPYSLRIFPHEWPLAAQIVLVFLIAEFGKYWAHRWHHESAALWELHAMHHSVERLYSLNNFRVHPLSHALMYSMSLLPLALLGAPQEALLVYAAMATAVSFFQHANIDLRFGPLNYVFSTNELHRWHHSTKLAEGNRNYGSVLIVWDLLFKTHHLPAGGQSPKRIGVTDAAYPRSGYLRQLLWPYCIRRCKAR